MSISLQIPFIILQRSVDYYFSMDKVFEMEKKECAYLNGALVFVVAGLRSKWKQAVSFAFVKDNMTSHELLHLLRRPLDKMTETGLCVPAFSKDQDSSFALSTTFLGVSRTNSAFQHDEQSIAFIAGPPHVLKHT